MRKKNYITVFDRVVAHVAAAADVSVRSEKVSRLTHVLTVKFSRFSQRSRGFHIDVAVFTMISRVSQ